MTVVLPQHREKWNVGVVLDDPLLCFVPSPIAAARALAELTFATAVPELWMLEPQSHDVVKVEEDLSR